MLIVAGGVIPPQDYEAVLKAGAAEIFPPGTVIPEAADRLMDRLLRPRSKFAAVAEKVVLE